MIYANAPIKASSDLRNLAPIIALSRSRSKRIRIAAKESLPP